MRTHFLALALAAVTSALPNSDNQPTTYQDGPCTGEHNAPGVCVPTASCTHDGGSYINDACPGTPEDIKCCVKPKCEQGEKKGDCRWTKDCVGEGKSLVQWLCPGPDAFRCCVDQPVGGNTTSISASGTSSATTLSTAASKPSETEKPKPTETPKPEKTLGEKILEMAKKQEGTDYVFGGGSCKGPTNGGLDCSGLVSWAVCKVTDRDLFSEGLRVTRDMYCASEKKLKYQKVKWEDRRVGDAVFFGGKCDCENYPKGIHHVGLMMDNEYTMWNALKTGTKVREDNFKNWDEKPCDHVIRFV